MVSSESYHLSLDDHTTATLCGLPSAAPLQNENVPRPLRDVRLLRYSACWGQMTTLEAQASWGRWETEERPYFDLPVPEVYL